MFNGQVDLNRGSMSPGENLDSISNLVQKQGGHFRLAIDFLYSRSGQLNSGNNPLLKDVTWSIIEIGREGGVASSMVYLRHQVYSAEMTEDISVYGRTAVGRGSMPRMHPSYLQRVFIFALAISLLVGKADMEKINRHLLVSTFLVSISLNS